MLNEVFWSHKSVRLLTLLAIDQLRAPGTNRVKAHAKLGFALGFHAHNAPESHSERRQTHSRMTH
jgi:hypothetical protein